MRSCVLIVCVALWGATTLAVAQHQGVDPAYLRQYYQQLQQAQSQQGGAEATPIYEQNSEQTQQYVSSGQQLRVKDTVQDQIRAQQQSQQQTGYVAPAVREYLQHQPQSQQIQYQTQPQSQVVYRAPQAAASPPRRAQPVHQYQSQAAPSKSKLQQQQEDEEYDDQNSSYQFGFDVKDDEFTNYQNRKEVRDGGVIKGSYSVVDSDGFIRTVKYTADPKEGFKAEVIREPTDIVVKVPTPAPQQQLLRASQHGSLKDYASKPHHQQQQQQQQQHSQPQYHHQPQYQHQYQQ